MFVYENETTTLDCFLFWPHLCWPFAGIMSITIQHPLSLQRPSGFHHPNNWLNELRLHKYPGNHIRKKFWRPETNRVVGAWMQLGYRYAVHEICPSVGWRQYVIWPNVLIIGFLAFEFLLPRYISSTYYQTGGLISIPHSAFLFWVNDTVK